VVSALTHAGGYWRWPTALGTSRAAPQRGAALVGFVYIGEQTLSHPFDASVLDGLSKCLQPDGYNVVILNPQRRRQSDFEFAELIAGMGMLASWSARCLNHATFALRWRS